MYILYLYFCTFIKYSIIVIYIVDYEQRRINEQNTVLKHTWKVKANATPMVQMNKKYRKYNNNNYVEYVHKQMKCLIGLAYERRLIIGI